MFLGIFLVILAIIYAIVYKSETLKIIYAGVALLILGGVFILAINITLSGGFARSTVLREDIALMSIYSALTVIPSGIVIMIIGFIMKLKSKK